MNRDVIENIRTDYLQDELERAHMLDDPMQMMKNWFQKAMDLAISEANAMTLATSTKEGHPSARIVLLKGIDDTGYLFYSNYYSKKGREISNNPNGALLFFWKEMERQVRIEGKIEQLDGDESKEYFQSRPKGSQLGAWASPQSKVILDRAELNDRLEELRGIYQNYEKLPRPAHWGGYRLVPEYYEFWQGRGNRLHDRFEYKMENDTWTINRLAP